VGENGNVGVWTQITVDEELGLVYLPVETPTSDYYGGHRPATTSSPRASSASI
jgi:quinoprotein glucose dehydrogenase